MKAKIICAVAAIGLGFSPAIAIRLGFSRHHHGFTWHGAAVTTNHLANQVTFSKSHPDSNFHAAKPEVRNR